tara:strand:+ start:40003 stop:41160 length:1158 start_codon:yes stop_codon:yes gene_type:complete
MIELKDTSSSFNDRSVDPQIKRGLNLSSFLRVSDLMVYLKTTETCQLNCSHCFTSGKNGKKIFFDPDAVVDWFHRFHQVVPHLKNGHVAFHGGEPFLAPISSMYKVWNSCRNLWPNVWWSATTNLVYNLDDEKRQFMKTAFSQGIATSWDRGIRFQSEHQETLWRKNVNTLLQDGHEVTVMISLSKDVIQMDVEDFLKWFADLGVQYLHLERITPNGNALVNQGVIPTNKELDDWFLKLWRATVKLESYTKFTNLFFNSILTSLVNRAHTGCRCRGCEQKIFTLNADGSIGGCPNSAATQPYAHLSMPIPELLSSPGRSKNILCEVQRNPICYSCDVFDVCNGDCHQLAWQGDLCASPKTLMQELKEKNDINLYRKMLNKFVGKE